MEMSHHQPRRHFGSHFPFWFVNNEPIFTIGPHWPFFLCMWICLIVVGIMVNVHVADQKDPMIRTAAALVTLWEAIIYLLTALRNPGISTHPNPTSADDDRFANDPNYCKACKVVRELDMYHCLDCDVCIKGFDHHCPWTGKCIGEGNIRYFYLFLLSTVVYLVFLYNAHS